MSLAQSLAQLELRMQEIKESLVENPVADFTTYLKSVYEYHGLKQAIAIIVRNEKLDDEQEN